MCIMHALTHLLGLVERHARHVAAAVPEEHRALDAEPRHEHDEPVGLHLEDPRVGDHAAAVPEEDERVELRGGARRPRRVDVALVHIAHDLLHVLVVLETVRQRREAERCREAAVDQHVRVPALTRGLTPAPGKPRTATADIWPEQRDTPLAVSIFVPGLLALAGCLWCTRVACGAPPTCMHALLPHMAAVRHTRCGRQRKRAQDSRSGQGHGHKHAGGAVVPGMSRLRSTAARPRDAARLGRAPLLLREHLRELIPET